MDIFLNILNVLMLCITSLDYRTPNSVIPPGTVVMVLTILHIKEATEWLFECFRGCSGSILGLMECAQGRFQKAVPWLIRKPMS